MKFKQLNIRKKLLILLVVLTVLGLIFILFAGKKEVPSPVVEVPEVITPLPPGGLTPSGFKQLAEQKETPEGKPFEKEGLIIEEEINFSTLSLDKEKHYYFSRQAKTITESSLLGKEREKVFESRFRSIDDVLWSSKKDKAVLSTNEGFYLLELEEGKLTPLSKNITNVIWSPDGSKIAYQYLDRLAGYNNISISDPDGSGWYKLIDVKSEGPSTTVFLSCWSPDGKWIYFTSESFDVTGGTFKRVNLDTKKIEDLSDWGNAGDILYSPDGSKILYITLDFNEEYQIVPNVRLMNADGTDKKDTGIDTYLYKCIWKSDNKSIICALSENINDPLSPDILVEMNLDTGERKQITGLDRDNPMNVRDLSLSIDEKILYFVNKINSKLYSLTLE